MSEQDRKPEQDAPPAPAAPLSADSLSAVPGEAARSDDGTFAPGNPGGPGRPPGAPNKVNAVLKDDILTAYQQRGGITWLLGLKDRDFVALLQRTMPKEVTADVKMQASGGLDLDLGKLSAVELGRLAHAVGVVAVDLAGAPADDRAKDEPPAGGDSARV